jgi:precorrin-6B methylase 1
MVIRIDISNLTNDLRDIILNSLELKSFLNDQLNNNDDNNNKQIIVLPNENNIQKLKQIIQNILTRNCYQNEYIVAENLEQKNEIAILKQGDMEQLGIYICTHCGLSFKSQVQRTIHERMHYFI